MAQVKDKVEYTVALIGEHYNIMHTLDFDEMVDSLAVYTTGRLD